MNQDLVFKRIFDVVASAVGLVVLSPVMLASAIAIKIDDPAGPVFFRQTRVGRGGKEFRIHKFRTMRVNQSGPKVTEANDPRVTRVGRFLRRYKLDELPQLLDVLDGTMSLVGPRPEVPSYVKMWGADNAEKILSVRPGITDPASIQFSNEQEVLADVADPERHYEEVLLPQKVQMYLDYVETRSFTGDLKLILATFGAVAQN